MLLAAGKGERLQPVTNVTPKPLVEVRGKPLIDYHLERLATASVATVVINLGWLGEQIMRYVGSGERYGLRVVYSPEGEHILETGGGVHRALPMLGEQPFVVINADIFTDMPLPDIALADEESGHLVLVPKPGFRPHGDFDLVDGKVRNSATPALTYAGFAVYRPEFFSGCEAGRFSIVPLMREAADEGRLGGSVYRGDWQDVGTPERLAALNQT
jgi:MurNAc alpha-1-phosphate uridylyltransferase